MVHNEIKMKGDVVISVKYEDYKNSIIFPQSINDA